MKKKIITATLISLLLNGFINYNFKTNQKQNNLSLNNNKAQKNMFSSIKTMFFSLKDYENYNKDYLLTYLINGGIIINDVSINSKIIKELYNVDALLNNYNSYVFFNGYSFEVNYFSIEYLNQKEQFILTSDNYMFYVDNIIKEIEKQSNKNQIMTINDSDSYNIYDKSINHFVYLNESEQMLSYTYIIGINRNSLTENIGNYNAISAIEISPKSNYAIKNYSFTIGLNSNLKLTTNYYENSIDFQTIIENKINEREIQIESNISSIKFGKSILISEYINFKSINELNASSFWIKINSLDARKNDWLLFQKNFSLNNDNKKKCIINWDKDGFLNQEETIL